MKSNISNLMFFWVSGCHLSGISKEFSQYTLEFDESKKAMETVKAGREAVAEFLNAPFGDTIISGESATKLLFDVSYAIGKECKGSENVVITELEHYANVSPWNELVEKEKSKRFDLRE